MSRIGIIGMGWLGLQLAEKLKLEAYQLLGTVSSKEKQTKIKSKFNEVEVLKLDELNEQTLNDKNIDFFVLTIPPSASNQYATKMKELIFHVLCNHPKASLLYTSSSSVYGSEARSVSEESETNAESANAKEIVAIEQYLIRNYAARSGIIRLGGLVGKNRHPIKYLSGKKGISKRNAPVNLVHAEDVCSLIIHLIKYDFVSGIYNLCCKEHPRKMEYYNWVAEQLNLPQPNFNLLDDQIDKTVICNAIKKINFEMKFKSPYDFPISN